MLKNNFSSSQTCNR